MDVAVIGAGPVGLFTALLLAQKGIRVTVCEAEKAVDDSPRACVWFPPVLEELEKAGILEEVITAGEKRGDGVDWRDADGKILAGITPPPNDPGFAVQLGQPEVCHIIIGKLRHLDNCEILFNHSFQSLEQKDGKVSYKVKNSQTGAEIEKQCDYLIGADGGRSSVRKELGIRLEGFTWDDFQFVAVNFQYHLKDWSWKGGNYVLDAIDWAIIVKRGKGNEWRMATGVPKKADERMASLDTETTELIRRRLRRMLPGDTSKIQFEAMAPYIVHQRCAERFREGNVFLAGDAAHLNSPVGALGLTTRMLDAAHLAQGLINISSPHPDSSMLNTYAESRRTIFKEYTEPKSRANFYRMYSQEPEHIQEREKRLASLNDHKNLVMKARAGPQWIGLSTTSSNINFLDTYKEITWFISVSKIPEWTNEKFEYEYRVVHANMTKKAHEMGAPILGYDQVENADCSLVGDVDRPSWDFVTCLQFPSLFVNYMGFKDPGYKANAGSHVFCRLDQKGCLAVKMKEYRAEGGGGERVRVRALVFHRREGEVDEVPLDWFYKHGDEMVEIAEKDKKVLAYTLYRDVTPKDTKRYFEDTQFLGGSWLEFKAVEAFDFASKEDAKAFLEKHVERFDVKVGLEPYVVIGKADKIV